MSTRTSRLVRLMGAAGLLAAAPLTLHAQQPAPRDTLPAYLLEGVTVTSRRAPEARAGVPQKIDVVTRTDLERTAATDVTDALKRNVAVDVVQYSGLLSGVSVRGFRPQFSGINARTLILLDGRPAGATNLATLDVAAVERIEVLKGPASALYGSNAMGGVINIVTRRSAGALRGSASGGYGSFQAYRGQLALGGDLAAGLDFDLSLATSGRNEGFRTGSRRTFGGESIAKTGASGRSSQLPELVRDTTLAFSEFATRSGSLRLGYALGERWRVDARGGLFAGDDVQNPGDLNSAFPYPTLNDLDRSTGEVSLTGQAGRNALTARVFTSREVTSYFNDASKPTYVSFRSPNRWYGAQLQDVARFGAHSLTAGVDLNAAEASSEVFSAADRPSAPYSPNSGIYSAAAFAEGRLSLLQDRLVATLGGRFDRVSFEVKETELLTTHRAGEETHSVFNPSAGLLFRAPAGVRLHASTGRAFVTPEAFNVAGYAEIRSGARAVRVTRGNPELDPESSVSWDAGVGLLRPRLGIDLDLTYFHTDVRDRITTRALPVAGDRLTAGGDTIRAITTYANADRAEIRGLDARASYDLGAAAGYAYSLRLFANATRILRAEETTGAATGRIRNVADLTAVFGAEYDDRRRFSTRLSGRYVGDRLDADWSDWMNPGDVTYPEYLVLDLSTSLRVADRYRVGVLVSNLGDENYYEVRGYNLPGRSLQLQFGVDF